jgi:hypothetical protein
VTASRRFGLDVQAFLEKKQKSDLRAPREINTGNLLVGTRLYGHVKILDDLISKKDLR